MLGLRYAILYLLAALTACTSAVPRESLIYPLATAESSEQIKTVVIPLPVIAASPNEGVTAGALTAFLLHNNRDEVTSLLAPQINSNPNFGTTYTLYAAFYPDHQRSAEVNLSRSSRINDDYEVRLRDVTLWDGKLENNLFMYHFSDGSARFFGRGAASPAEGETNFTARENGFTYTGSYQAGQGLFVQFGERLRRVGISAGAINSVPYIRNRFTAGDAPGIDGFTAHAQKGALLYNTLDSPTMPLSGIYARMSIEWSGRALGSESDYLRYELEGRGIVPNDRDRQYITAFRALFSQVTSGTAPFMEQSIAGGESTLRGYGKNRFIDKAAMIFNLEERIRLFRWKVFDVNADWELAPFIDVAAVTGSLEKVTGRDFRYTPGCGLRAVVRPNIVGRMDIGFGGEGAAVFVGLGYPF